MLGKVLGMHLFYLRICQGRRIGHAVTNNAKHRLLVLNFFQLNFIDMLLNIHKKNHISQCANIDQKISVRSSEISNPCNKVKRKGSFFRTCQWLRCGVFIVNFEPISHLLLVFLLLTFKYNCRLGHTLADNFLQLAVKSEILSGGRQILHWCRLKRSVDQQLFSFNIAKKKVLHKPLLFPFYDTQRSKAIVLKISDSCNL